MSSGHIRNTATMRTAPRCGARTRRGTECQAPAIQGKARCRMHGGKGSGAPAGNHNAFKTGLHTAEAHDLRLHVNRTLREGRQVLKDIADLPPPQPTPPGSA